jgi:hypothetical protein
MRLTLGVREVAMLTGIQVFVQRFSLSRFLLYPLISTHYGTILEPRLPLVHPRPCPVRFIVNVEYINNADQLRMN